MTVTYESVTMLLLIISSLSLCTFSTASNYTYMVVHPRYARPNSDFLVHVQLYKIVCSENLTVELVTTDQKDVRKSVFRKFISLTPGMKETDIILPIPANLESYFYQLEVNGAGDVPFKTVNSVYAIDKAVSVFIQTDKAQYNPGQLVQYRVFAVDPGLKPLSVILDVEIFDAKGNKLSETNEVQNIFGTAGSFRLSDIPVQGIWHITAKVKGTEMKEFSYFKVEEYVLPKFEVTVQLPSYGTRDNPSLYGVVRARYTFGKPVQGVCVLRVERQYQRSLYDPVAVHTQFTINGEGSFTIPITVLRRLSRDIERESFRVIANVTETLTGITESNDETITFYPEKIKVEFAPYMTESFRPGFPYHVAVKVTEQDGRPLVNPTESLKINVTYFTKTAVSGVDVFNTDLEFIGPFPLGKVVFVPNKQYTISPDGFVTFDLEIPDYVFTANILAEFAGRKVYKDIIRFQSPSSTFLKVELLTKSPEIGKNAVFSVTGSKRPGEVTYHILSKSLVLLTGKVTVNQSNVAQTFNVHLTSNMVPAARILVYYVASDGEIVADGITFMVHDIFQNKVDIKFSQIRLQPGESVDVHLKADPDSLICVLAVDKSVLLLGTGNDITEERVRDNLDKYGGYGIHFARGWGILPPWPIPADDVSDIFSEAGLIVSTDGNLHNFDIWSLIEGVIPRTVEDEKPLPSQGSGKVTSTLPRVRKFFPETMIFTNITADANGTAKLTQIVPDTITEWVANAFALNVESGLGIAALTANLTVFQKFFVNLQLPYSVVRGEEVVIQASVFNYYDTDEYVLLTLKGSNDFDGITINGTRQNEVSTGNLTQCVQVKSNEPKAVFFTIRPKSIGSINLQVQAQSHVAADALMIPLLVKAEGEPKEYNRPVLISLSEGGTFLEQVRITYPQNVVQGSQSVRVTLIGDILGPSMENLDNLIQLPYGCGEQNILNFAPSVYAAHYLKQTGRLPDDSVKLEDIRFKLRTGYQRELVYQRSDGSFSAFGDADESGSIWLTAFVGKSFAQATDLIFIDPRVIEKLVKYIIKQQSDDGLFNITGIVHHRAIQGGSAESRRSLGAYILIALKEIQAQNISKDESSLLSLNKAIATAETALANATELTTEYEIAIIAYALSLTESYKTNASFILNTLVQSGDVVNEDGLRYWKNDSQSLQIEIAAYALLAYTALRDTDNGLPVLRWLIKQRNPYGGFVSTQDTVIAIQSLSSFAALTYTPVVDIRVTLQVGTAMENLTLNRENNDVLTVREFPGTTELISVTATGTGMGLLEVGVFYNVLGESVSPSFTLDIETSEERNNSFILTACTRWTEVVSSGMVLLDIGAPSGFVADKSSVVMISEIKRIEESSRRLVIYFDQVMSEICTNVTMRRESLVAKVQAATVRVYSYYDPEKLTVRRYLPRTLIDKTVCDICGVDCGCDPENLVNAMDMCNYVLLSTTIGQ
ncbi:hypothetical protein CHS0354_024459 [Potamilus streckersoni]|uniref:CD109 antigen n=1 Tax=Potamilus streckersoni TaxID=2493646 RepID=A0AAE0TLB9_9BIVA|nr:hypothetical protein CHS0354_024459 [Potamilus streckersoni]